MRHSTTPRDHRIRAACRRGGALAPAVVGFLLFMTLLMTLGGVLGLLPVAAGALAAFVAADAARAVGARSVRRAVATHRAARGEASALRARLLAALATLATSRRAAIRAAARRTAPPPATRGGRAIAFVALTPRLLGQRPQLARADRAG